MRTCGAGACVSGATMRMIVWVVSPLSPVTGTSATTRLAGVNSLASAGCSGLRAGAGLPAVAMSPKTATNPAREAAKTARRAAASRSRRSRVLPFPDVACGLVDPRSGSLSASRSVGWRQRVLQSSPSPSCSSSPYVQSRSCSSSRPRACWLSSLPGEESFRCSVVGSGISITRGAVLTAGLFRSAYRVIGRDSWVGVTVKGPASAAASKRRSRPAKIPSGQDQGQGDGHDEGRTMGHGPLL